jgi:hypothetical protein
VPQQVVNCHLQYSRIAGGTREVGQLPAFVTPCNPTVKCAGKLLVAGLCVGAAQLSGCQLIHDGVNASDC